MEARLAGMAAELASQLADGCALPGLWLGRASRSGPGR